MDHSLGSSRQGGGGGGRGRETGREEENISSVHLLHHLLGNNLRWCLGSSVLVSGCCLYNQNGVLNVICILGRVHRKTASIPDQDLNLLFLTPAHSFSWVWGYFCFYFSALFCQLTSNTIQKRKAKRSQIIHVSIIKTKTLEGLQDYPS